MANFLECVWDIQLSMYAPMFAADFDLLENLTGSNDENLKYIEDETGAEIVAAPQKGESRTDILLCARHKTVDSLNRAVYLLERLQESVLGDLKHFLRKHRLAPPGVLEVSDDIIDTNKVYQCNLCAHAVGNQLELMKDHLKTPDHLVKKAASTRLEKQSEPIQDVVAREQLVSDTDTVAMEIVSSLSLLLKDQIKMTSVNMLQGLVEAESRKSEYQHTLSNYPDSEVYCKMCSFQANSLSDMRNHNISNKHRFKYLNLQLMLGHDKFNRIYGQTLLPGIQTNNGRALASKIVQSRFDYQDADREIFSNELQQELHRRMMLYTGWINKGNCKVCEKSLFPTWDGHSFGSVEWVQHINGRNHAKACISALVRKGKDAYQRDHGMIPIAAPSKVKAVLNSSDWMELSETYKQMSHLSHLPSLAADIRNKTLVPETKAVDKSSFGGLGEAQNTASGYDDKRDRSLHIRNYPDGVNESDIQSLFFPYGKVKSVRLFRDKGFGFVEFIDPTVVDYILKEKMNSFSMQGIKLEINGCGRKMMRSGFHLGGVSKYNQPIVENVPSQDVNNLQPDEQGFYTISFTNDGHFSSFEEAVTAFMMYGLVKDYHNLASGKTFVRYMGKECAIKAWSAMGQTLKDFTFPLPRQYSVAPKPDVVQRLNIIAKKMGFIVDSDDIQTGSHSVSQYETIPGLQTSLEQPMPNAEVQPVLSSPLSTSVPPGVLVTGPPSSVPSPMASGIPPPNMQNATVRMLTAGVPLNPGVMATLQRQTAVGAQVIPTQGGMFIGQPGLQQLQQAGLFRHPPPGYLPTGIPGLGAQPAMLHHQGITPRLFGPGMILGAQGLATPETLGAAQQGDAGAEIGNIASSVMATVQPQLEALQKAMAQKGVDPVQMLQLQQAMATLQSFIANSSQQTITGTVDTNKFDAGLPKDNPPWLTATGDIDERKARNTYPSLISSGVPPTVQRQVPTQAASNMGQAPWLARQSEISAAVTPMSVTPSDQPPWSQGKPAQSKPTLESSGPSSAVGRPPWARSGIAGSKAAPFGSETSQNINNPPWSKAQPAQPLSKRNEAPWQSSASVKRADSSTAPPWASQPAKAQAAVPPWGKTQADVKSKAAPWAKTKGSTAIDRSLQKTPWDSKRQTELESRAVSHKKTKYDPFEREHRGSREEDVVDKRLAEINRKMAAMDRKIKEYEEKEHRRKSGNERSRSRSRDRDRRRRSRSRDRWDRSRDHEETRYRSRRDRSKSPRTSRRSPGDRGGAAEENRFGRWARDEKRDTGDQDIIDRLRRATGLTNEILLNNIMQKMKNVAPNAVMALSECDGKVIQQLTLTGGAMVVPIMPVLQTLQQALGLARTQESYYVAAKIVGVFKEMALQGKVSHPGPSGPVTGSRWT